MRLRLSRPLAIVITSAAILLAALYLTYRLIDPLPPRHFIIAAGMSRIRDTITLRGNTRAYWHAMVFKLEIRNAAGAVEDLELLRDPGSRVQAALTTFGLTGPADEKTLYSVGGIFDAAIFIFYRNAEPITQFAQFRGKRLSIGMRGTPHASPCLASA